MLQGLIKRSDGDDIRTVIWFCDQRDSTPLAEALGRETFLAALNQFFEATAGAAPAPRRRSSPSPSFSHGHTARMHVAGMPRDPTAQRESRHVPRRMQRPSLARVQATAPTCGLESCQSASTCLASVALSSMTAWVAVLLHSSIT